VGQLPEPPVVELALPLDDLRHADFHADAAERAVGGEVPAHREGAIAPRREETAHDVAADLNRGRSCWSWPGQAEQPVMVIVRAQIEGKAQSFGLLRLVELPGPAQRVLGRQVRPPVRVVVQDPGPGPLRQGGRVASPERNVSQAVDRIVGAPRGECIRGGECQPCLVDEDVPDVLGTHRGLFVHLNPDGVPAFPVRAVIRHPGTADSQRAVSRQAPDRHRARAAEQDLGAGRAVVKQPRDPSAMRHAHDRLDLDIEPVVLGAGHHGSAHLVRLVGRDIEHVPADDRSQFGRPARRDRVISDDLQVNGGIRDSRDVFADVVGIKRRR